MTPAATAVLDDVDDALSSAAAVRHEAAVADIPDLKPIPGPWEVASVLRFEDSFLDDEGDERTLSFEVDGITYDRARPGLGSIRPMFTVRLDAPRVGIPAARKSYAAADHDLNDVVWIATVNGRDMVTPSRVGEYDHVLAITYRYADEGWVW